MVILRKTRVNSNTPLIFLFISFTLFATLSLHLRHLILYQSPYLPPPPHPLLLSTTTAVQVATLSTTTSSSRRISSSSILFPDWEVLVIASPETPPSLAENYSCVFNDNSHSPARFAAQLPYQRGIAFKCLIPVKDRRRSSFLEPQLKSLSSEKIVVSTATLRQWTTLVYESFTTEHDVVLFVKGVNNRQGSNLSPSDLRCVFGDDLTFAVKTSVTSSAQQVFRCLRPNLPEHSPRKISVTLEINGTDSKFLPSVAQYSPYDRRRIELSEPKSLICACTMVYNVRKFLREWVTYHARVGIERFILYDNDSDDGLDVTVGYLNRAGFDVRTVYWPWPKTQEAGFSHCALHAEKLCQWVAFIDVDEFILSPTWQNQLKPNPNMLSLSLLPKETNPVRVGQVSIKCVEFGPSNQTVHPVQGVTQGYTCRRKSDRRHKSIVMLEAVHPSLLNMVHHFKLRDGFLSSPLGKQRAIVNHYKYQAWPEFRSKFRRRVSAYVVDWQKSVNLKSNDRVPGLGFQAVEPHGWAKKFCDKVDMRLKVLTRRWFRVNSSQMQWQTT